MGLIENLSLFFLSSSFLYILLNLIRFLNKLWWTPRRIEYSMRSQGIRGPSYKFLHGNTKEISDMKRHSIGTPMDGFSHEIYPRILPHMHAWANKYGMNFLNWYGPQAQLVVTDAELIKEILHNKHNCYSKIDLDGYVKMLLGDGISSCKGEKWAKMRKLTNHVFHGDSLKGMIPAMITSTETMLERWKEHDGKEIEVCEEFRLLTSEIISRTAFGSSYLEGEKIFEMLTKLTLIIARNAQKIRFPGINKFIKSGDDMEAEKLKKGIQDCIMEIISKREFSKEGKIQNSESDFLGKLLDGNHETDKNKWIPMEIVVDECKTFYFAGQETTASLLGWTIFLLALHDDWQEKARKEVVELFGKKIPSSDGIARLKIMNMIIEESLRLYPPAPALKRKVVKKVQLGNLTLPPHVELYIAPLAQHHDPKIWGEDVHVFRPERFAGGLAKATNNTATAFMPFGFGPRTCVGLNFAFVEAKIVLSMILQRYMFSLSPTYVHSPIQVFLIRPQHGVQVILHEI